MALTATTEVDFRGHKRKVHYRPKTSDEGIFRDVFVGKAYDLGRLTRGRELAAYFDKKANEGKSGLVVDAGANVGAASLYFHMLLGKPRIVAVESSTENFSVLEKNVTGLDIRCINAAISATKGLAQVVDPGTPGGFCAYQATPVGNGKPPMGKPLEIVPRVTVNDIYSSELDRAFPFVVKVDIEGGEADLFSQNTEWVERTPLLIIELHDWLLPKQGSSESFLKCIAALDRDFFPLGENIYSIANQFP